MSVCLACWPALAVGVAISCCCCWPFGCCHVHMHCIIILALPVWWPWWRAACSLLWLSSLLLMLMLMPADGRAHREGAREGTVFISMLQQLPHHTRIICTRKYARTLAHTTADLVPLSVRGINKDDDDGAVAGSSNVGQGVRDECATAREVTRSIKTEYRKDLFPGCFATRRSAYNNSNNLFSLSARVGSTARRKRRRVCCSRCCLLLLARATTFRPTVYLTVAATLLCPALPRYC